MDAQIEGAPQLEIDLRQALADGEFELYYQPLRQPEARASSAARR